MFPLGIEIVNVGIVNVALLQHASFSRAYRLCRVGTQIAGYTLRADSMANRNENEQ